MFGHLHHGSDCVALLPRDSAEFVPPQRCVRDRNILERSCWIRERTKDIGAEFCGARNGRKGQRKAKQCRAAEYACKRGQLSKQCAEDERKWREDDQAVAQE